MVLVYTSFMLFFLSVQITAHSWEEMLLLLGLVMQRDLQLDVKGTAALHLPAFSTAQFGGVCGSAVFSGATVMLSTP